MKKINRHPYTTRGNRSCRACGTQGRLNKHRDSEGRIKYYCDGHAPTTPPQGGTP